MENPTGCWSDIWALSAMINNAPVVMECSVKDIYETKGFESFICTIDNTYAEEAVLTPEGKVN